MSEFYKYIQSEKMNGVYKQLLKGTWWLYITFLTVLLIRPFMSFRYHLRRFNLSPLKTINLYFNSYASTQPMELVYNFLGNIVLFVPFGFLLPLCFGRGRSLAGNVMYTFLFSFGVELWQIIFKVGIFDVDDILLNVIGGVIGYCIYKLEVILPKA